MEDTFRVYDPSGRPPVIAASIDMDQAINFRFDLDPKYDLYIIQCIIPMAIRVRHFFSIFERSAL